MSGKRNIEALKAAESELNNENQEIIEKYSLRQKKFKFNKGQIRKIISM